GKGAKLHREVVTVFGRIDNPDDVNLPNSPVEIDPLGLGSALRQWFTHCFLMLRPLAPQVGWVWVVAGFFFLVYLLIAVILPKPVQLCLGELTRRPATTFFVGLLAKILIPVLVVLLLAIGIGVVVVPFL